MLNSKVQSVRQNCVTVSGPDGVNDIPFGASIWATGVAMHPLLKDLQVIVPKFWQPDSSLLHPSLRS